MFEVQLSKYYLIGVFKKMLVRLRRGILVFFVTIVAVYFIISTKNGTFNKVEESPVEDGLKIHLLVHRIEELLTKSPAVEISKKLPPERLIKFPNRNSVENGLCQPLHYIPNSDSRPVTALVSFPGSGNTWLRHLIQQATGIYTGSQYVDERLQSKGFPGEAVTNASVAVVKTHEWGPQIRQRFDKAVLLVRSPGPAIQAWFNLWSGGHTGVASPWQYKRNNGRYWEKFVTEFTRDWLLTNLDWIRNFTEPLHVVRYETLLTDLGPTLRALVQFLDLPLDEGALRCAVERQEGAHHRKTRAVDRFTDQMKKDLKAVEDVINKEVENMIKYSR